MERNQELHSTPDYQGLYLTLLREEGVASGQSLMFIVPAPCVLTHCLRQVSPVALHGGTTICRRCYDQLKKLGLGLSMDRGADWFNEQLAIQGGACAGCSRLFDNDFRPSIDHVVPTAHGGDDDFANLQLLCVGCNASKGRLSELEWRQLHPNGMTEKTLQERDLRLRLLSRAGGQ